MGSPTLRIAQDPAADELLSRDPLALLIGMLLDQRVWTKQRRVAAGSQGPPPARRSRNHWHFGPWRPLGSAGSEPRSTPDPRHSPNSRLRLRPGSGRDADRQGAIMVTAIRTA